MVVMPITKYRASSKTRDMKEVDMLKTSDEDSVGREDEIVYWVGQNLF